MLDQILASAGVGRTRSFVLPMSITDHLPVCTTIESANPLTNSEVKKIETRVFNESNKEFFRALFSSLQLILTFDNFNLVFSHFYKMFLAYDTAFPIIKKKLQTKAEAPWMTEKIRKCILKKNKLYKLYLKGGIEKMVYTTFRNKLTCIIRRVKALYYAELFLENSSDPKKIWDILNGLINNGSKTVLEEIIENNTTLKGKRMVNYINDFFL